MEMFCNAFTGLGDSFFFKPSASARVRVLPCLNRRRDGR